MIEVEWWDYDDAAEMAAAVAGDVGFIVESALDARSAALIALPGGKTPLGALTKLAARRAKCPSWSSWPASNCHGKR